MVPHVALATGAASRAVLSASRTAFTDGLQLALVVGAMVALAAAAGAFFLLRSGGARRRPAEAVGALDLAAR